MKITKIEYIKNIYYVTLEPNYIEKLFGCKGKIKKYKDSGSNYMCGGGTIYINEDGEKTSNGSYIGETIDIWRRKQLF